ncbi:MAG: alkaline phosphatase D family protein [Alphaproteobacteria bacterium]
MHRYCVDRYVTMDRRRLLKGLAASAVLTTGSGTLAGCAALPTRFDRNPFGLGIASGEPEPDGMVLWTKVTAAPDLDRSVIPVRWEVAADDRMIKTVRSGETAAHPDLGHAVHVEVEGLSPGRDYFYRFQVGGEASMIGRTRSAPAAGAPVDRLRFAVCGCQRRDEGHYTAYAHLADEQVDFVYHYGDYIYESLWRRARDLVWLQLGLVNDTPDDAFRTLDYYRRRYALYKSDPLLQAAHASAPFITIWDDHEIDNNWAADADQFDGPPELFLLRRAAAFQVYYEMMPLRRSCMPHGPMMQAYRRFAWGDLAAFNVLDTRQYRSNQPCGDGRKSRAQCPESLAPGRTMLGDAQEAWLLDGLGHSQQRWNVLAQQVMMMQLDRSSKEDVDAYHMDKWDGAVDARRRLLDFVHEHGVANLVALSGDIHQNWAGELKLDFDEPGSATVGHEFVATSITSGGDGADHHKSTPKKLAQNPHMTFFNDQRGYMLCEVTPNLWTTRYRTVDFVSRPGAPIRTRRSLAIEAGRTGLVDA